MNPDDATTVPHHDPSPTVKVFKIEIIESAVQCIVHIR